MGMRRPQECGSGTSLARKGQPRCLKTRSSVDSSSYGGGYGGGGGSSNYGGGGGSYGGSSGGSYGGSYGGSGGGSYGGSGGGSSGCNPQFAMMQWQRASQHGCKCSLRGGYGGSSLATRMPASFGRLRKDFQPRYDPYVENKKFDEARRRREDERDELLGLRLF